MEARVCLLIPDAGGWRSLLPLSPPPFITSSLSQITPARFTSWTSEHIDQNLCTLWPPHPTVWPIPKYSLGKHPYDVEKTESSFDRNKKAKKEDL